MNYSNQNIKNKRLRLRSKKDRVVNSILLFCVNFTLLAILTVCVCGAGLGLGALKGIVSSTPLDYNLTPQFSATVIYDDMGTPVQYLSNYDSNRILVSSEEIPSYLKNAFVAIEDERFYEHNGVDIKGIGRAFVNNLRNGNISQGASTITQQLIKNNVFNVGGEKNTLAKVKRKIQEQYLAIRAEKENDKETILTNYLNTINLGKGTLGVEAAAKYYFGKTSAQLTLSECAVIAGITKNPSYLNPLDYAADNNERRLVILKKMLELNFISSEEYQEALADETVYQRIAEYRQTKQSLSTYSYFTDAIIMQIVSDLQQQYGYTQSQAYSMIYRGGLKIYSTQNTQMQQIADSEINNISNYPVATKLALEYTLEIKHANGESSSYNTSDLRKYFSKKKKKKKKNYRAIYKNLDDMCKATEKFKASVLQEGDSIIRENIMYSLQPQMSYTLIDHKTGQVKVIVGGRGEKQDDLSLNRATNVTRQPGSTFKILSTYGPGIETGGMTLASVYDDCAYKYESGVSVHNAEKTYYGLMTVRDAIIESDNVVAVKAITGLSPAFAYNYLQALGFTSLVPEDVNQSLALGGITKGVTNLQLTGAYSSIANKGYYNKPFLYTQVVDPNGNVLLQNASTMMPVMSESTAWLLTNAMQDVIKKGTGKEAKLSSKMAVAGKTGTTSNNYDYWFCGYTPYYTASIWSGYDLNTNFATSADYHKEIWAKIMNRIIAETGQKVKKDFDSCNSIEKAVICAKSGKLPEPGLCSNDPEKSMEREEYFAKGTVPTSSCDTHIKLTLCKESHRIAIEHCPTEKGSRYSKVYRIKPADSKGTTADTPYCLNFNPSSFTCNIHTEEWYQQQLIIKQQQEQQQQATNPDGTPTQPAAPMPGMPPATVPGQ